MSNIPWTDDTSNPLHLIKLKLAPNFQVNFWLHLIDVNWLAGVKFWIQSIKILHGGHWCKKHSTGCANCYAEAQNQSNYFKFASHLKYTGLRPKNFILDVDILKKWLSLRTTKKIFVCSMTDIFGNWVTDEELDVIFAYAAIANHHTFQFLTKRPDRMLSYFSDDSSYSRIAEVIESNQLLKGRINSPYVINDLNKLKSSAFKNCWFGTSIEDQKAVTDRGVDLYKLHNRGFVTFYSVEPLLEEVELWLNHERTDWVIVGGESGNKARQCDISWIRSIVEQCQISKVPVFVKQLGAKSIFQDIAYKTKDRKGETFEELPVDLQIREFPTPFTLRYSP